ncbi:Hypothetical protein HEAR2250 [Herminiimonas arsenicoxydans]|uniref:Uncharacterized protein n=1 Tax=Herminiimonas arsenicoxydans TaxID=204773 RepID=A4G797_HERAR|nr:Hypothetical protein HEAR2250 [Herminiimonas arsenicoxydans]
MFGEPQNMKGLVEKLGPFLLFC